MFEIFLFGVFSSRNFNDALPHGVRFKKGKTKKKRKEHKIAFIKRIIRKVPYV